MRAWLTAALGVASSSGASTAPTSSSLDAPGASLYPPASSSLDAPGASLYLRPTSAEQPLTIRAPTISGVFKIAQVADPHLGYTSGSDAQTYELLRAFLH